MGFDGDIPDLQVYLKPTIFLLALFAVFDFFIARHTKARWFAVHTLANSIVTVCSLPGLWRIIVNPVEGMMSNDFSALGISANLCIHIYHVLAFRDLIWLDWLHHFTMTAVVMPITYSYDSFYGPMVDVMNFFSCGLPGGLDYAMLFAVKHGWMASITEKKYNSTINNWLRAPGIIFTCGIVYVQAFMKDPTATLFELAAVYELLIISLFIWNAQFFSARVVGNYQVRKFQEEQKRQEGKSKNGVN